MKEAEITCRCLSIRLPDLNKVLFKGQVVYVDAERARASKDLQVAQRASGVSVRYVERCVIRQEPVSKLVPPAPSPVVRKIQPKRDPVDCVSLADVLKAQLREFLGTELTPLVRQQVVQALQETLTLAQPNVRIRNVPQKETDDVGTIGETPLVFVPEHISGGLRADISVDKDESSGDSVDAAAKALRKKKGDGRR